MIERPAHERVFNASAEYALSKARRLKKREEGNQVVLYLLGPADFKRASDELEGA